MFLLSSPSFHRGVRHLQAVALVCLCMACSRAPAAPTPPAQTAAPAPPAPASAAPAAPGAPPAGAPVRGRVVAIGDLHADLDDTLAVFRMAGLVDSEGHWAGGRTIFVQTGDVTDRGPDSKEVIELLQALGPEAAAAGGQVVPLLGNHEAMNLTGDLRYVSPLDVADFGSAAARAAAFSPTGPIGAWLRGLDAVHRLGDTVYVHGGVSPHWAEVGVDDMNRQARAAIATDPRAPVLGPEGPLWLRDYLLADEAIACPMLARALDRLGVRRMVVGHTTQRSGQVAVRCGGALLGIDTGISSHYGAQHAAVEIIDGDARAIYPRTAVDLPDPPAP